jgi:hypothetical protein
MKIPFERGTRRTKAHHIGAKITMLGKVGEAKCGNALPKI